jgi:hypothetical protein
MTLFLTDISRHQVERPDPLDLAKAKAAGMNAVNIQLDRGRQDDVLPAWAPEYAEGARSLGLGVSTYRWLDARIPGGESARRAFERMHQMGGPDGMAHAVDCEDNATQQHLRDYVTTMTGLLGRPIAIYSGSWWMKPRGWQVDDLSPYLWSAPVAGYLGSYPGDQSPHWTVAYGGYQTLAAMQYARIPLPGTGDCSLSAIRDPDVWATLTGGGVPANPNPTRISAPLWWLITKCTDLTPTSFVNEHGGVWVRQAGSHSDAGWLKTNLPNDYSLKGTKQQNGPQQYGRAWDWTFPSAQGGNYDAIVLYSARLKKAWETNDPRAYPIFEALCEADYDYDPEGYVFYPTKTFRVPDRTHKWHIHLGILTAYINDQAAMEAVWSILRGESLAAWQAGDTTKKGDRMFSCGFNGDPAGAIYVSDGFTYRHLTSWPGLQELVRIGAVVNDDSDVLIFPSRGDMEVVAGKPWAAPGELALTDEQAALIAAAIVADVDTPLGAADSPAIENAVKKAVRELVAPPVL